MLGTMGAFIRIKAPIRSKRELFDVGFAGPVAGFVALLPFLLFGIARSRVGTMPPGASFLLPGHCLAIELATRLFHGPLAPARCSTSTPSRSPPGSASSPPR